MPGQYPVYWVKGRKGWSAVLWRSVRETRGAGRGAPRAGLAAAPQECRDIEVRGIEATVGRHFLDRRRATVLLVDFAAGLGPGHETGGDHGDLDLARHLLVDDRAEDDVGVLVGGAAHDLGGLVDFVERQVGAAGDIEEDDAGTVDRGFEQGAGDRVPGGIGGRLVDAPEGGAHGGGTMSRR